MLNRAQGGRLTGSAGNHQRLGALIDVEID